MSSPGAKNGQPTLQISRTAESDQECVSFCDVHCKKYTEIHPRLIYVVHRVPTGFVKSFTKRGGKVLHQDLGDFAPLTARGMIQIRR